MGNIFTKKERYNLTVINYSGTEKKIDTHSGMITVAADSTDYFSLESHWPLYLPGIRRKDGWSEEIFTTERDITLLLNEDSFLTYNTPRKILCWECS